jgi:AcrR family transcriptional regulator
MSKPRPGGRSARIKTAVFEAAEALIVSKALSELTMVDIAQRAGVNSTSLYRRWGDLESLLMEVAINRLMHDSPLPDTGSLRGDILTWAESIAASLAGAKSSVFVQVFLATAAVGGTGPANRISAFLPRQDEFTALLDRARLRGEFTPQIGEVIDYIAAPLYFRMLIGAPEGKEYASTLVDRLLAG